MDYPSAFGIHSNQWRSCLTEQHRFQKQPAIPASAAGTALVNPAMRLHLRPLGIRQALAIHENLLSELGSQKTQFRES